MLERGTTQCVAGRDAGLVLQPGAFCGGEAMDGFRFIGCLQLHGHGLEQTTGVMSGVGSLAKAGTRCEGS